MTDTATPGPTPVPVPAGPTGTDSDWRLRPRTRVRHPLLWMAGAAVSGLGVARATGSLWAAAVPAVAGLVLLPVGIWRSRCALTAGILLLVAGAFAAHLVVTDRLRNAQQFRFPAREKTPVLAVGTVVEPPAPMQLMPDPGGGHALDDGPVPPPPMDSDEPADDDEAGLPVGPQRMQSVFVLEVREYRGGDRPMPLSPPERLRVYSDAAWPALAVGEQIELPLTLVTPAGATNPGQFDYRRWLLEQGLARIGLWRFADGIRRITPPGATDRVSVGGFARTVRQRITQVVYRELGPAQAPLLLTLSVGQRAGLSDHLTDAFRRTGTIHLLVVSGLHVGLFALVFEGLLLAFRVPVRVRAGAAIVLLLFVRELAGGQVAVTRAVAFGIFWYGALLVRRHGRFPNQLGGAVLVVLALNPHDLFGTGFALSFLAVVWLRYFAVPEREPVDPGPAGRGGPGALRLLEGAAATLWASLVVFIGLAPVLWHAYGQVAVSAVLVNVLAIPVMLLVALCTVPMVLLIALGVLLGVGWLLEPLAAALAQLASAIMTALVRAVELVAEQPWACVELPLLHIGWVVAFELLLLAVVFRRPLRLPVRRIALAAGLLGLAFTLQVAQARQPQPPEAMVLDLGHATCTVLVTPAREAVIVDPGEPFRRNVAERVIVPALKAQGVTRIAAIVITRDGWGHSSELDDLLDRLPVRRILLGPALADDELAARWRTAHATRLGIPVDPLRVGDALAIDGTMLTALGPPPGIGPDGHDDDRSLVLLWEAGPLRLLLPGDVRDHGIDAQLALASAHRPLSAALLPRQGRDAILLADWLAAWQPPLAIATGREPPAEGVKARVAAEGLTLISAAQSGAVRLVADDNHVTAWRWARTGWVPVALPG